ncbi:Uma2 family endonuclease [Streptomyces sp. NPDC057287]|uniref:Uma2 family endonuclease n=1 Tax=Streptomyces sp. NPDC057287 TaxID=3346086 RepID=UPI00362E9C76
MTALPDWMRPPRAEGWFAEDLDHLPEAPRHTELIDGALVFVMSPHRWWHGHLVTMLTVALMEQAPTDVRVGREMAIKLDQRNRPEPDLLVTTADFDGDRTWFAPDEVRLAVEVVSPESAHRDRTVKLHKYAEAGIPHYWRIEDGAPIVHVYELDEPTATYVPVGIFRGSLHRPVPFEINLDLQKLAPPHRG